ncbi:MAG: phytochelatin synthase family protein [Pseudomonadota bacterium]
MKKTLKKLNRYRQYFGLYLQSQFYAMVNHGWLKKPVATPVSQYDHTASHSSHPVFQALSSAFAYQFNEAACSAASTATVLNAGKTILNGHTASHRITQHEILKKVDAADWAARISPEGFRNRRGLPLGHLGTAVKKAFEVYEVPCESMETVPLFDRSARPDILQRTLLERLAYFQNSRYCFLIAHFNQGVFLKGLHLPHISPVMSVDMEHKMVCILDVDPQVKEPYWISLDTFWKGLSWRYGGIIRKHGYEGGGYIWIKLKKPESSAFPVQNLPDGV